METSLDLCFTLTLTASQEQQAEIEVLRAMVLKASEEIPVLEAERDRYKAALDKADNLFMDNGTISAAEYKIIETGKAFPPSPLPCTGRGVMVLIIKPFRVSVAGYGDYTYFTSTRGKALSKAFGDFGSISDIPFKEFLKIARAVKGVPTENFGTPITVGGKSAYFVSSNRQYVQFVRDDSAVILNSHPYDVEPEHMRPDTYRSSLTPDKEGA